MIERDGVVALEPDGRADAEFFRGDAGGMKGLEHQGGGATFEPTPADLVGGVRGPFVLHGEAETVHVEAEGSGHVRDHEEGDDFGDVGRRDGCGGHGA